MRAALIGMSALVCVIIVTLDSTIAVIALPSIQSSLGASQEQIAWVITSYLVASAVATPLSGWLADRFGRGRIMALSVAGFTVSSIGCGASNSLEMLVLFRFCQGFTGASLVPLSQVLLLDIYPPEKHGTAIAVFGLGTLLGPTVGPTLGAWLTETFSWRWIFLINLPAGIAGFTGLVLFLKDRRADHVQAFDMGGFAAVSVALTSLQLMLDRGQMLDWFSSTEIWIEATIAGAAAWMALVHILTTRHPFIRPVIFRNRNFLIGTLLSALTGVLLSGVVPLMTGMMQQLLGYPVMLAGMLALPRALANMTGIVIAGSLVRRMDPRVLIVLGLVLIVASVWILSGLSLQSRQDSLALVAFLQGLGAGFLFLPLTLAVFTSLPQELRNEGATLFALVRNLGGAIGLSVLQARTIRDTAAIQSRLVENVRPDNPLVGFALPSLDFNVPGSVAMMRGEIARQASMLAYVDSFRLLLYIALFITPLCLLLRHRPTKHGGPPTIIHAD
jgi:DHA2 family multidrug resistance protein